MAGNVSTGVQTTVSEGLMKYFLCFFRFKCFCFTYTVKAVRLGNSQEERRAYASTPPRVEEGKFGGNYAALKEMDYEVFFVQDSPPQVYVSECS